MVATTIVVVVMISFTQFLIFFNRSGLSCERSFFYFPLGMDKVLKVGITGGIGSGKSTVARIFEALGYAVYRADDRAKWLMVNDPALIEGVKALFGKEAYDSEGRLNRKLIGGIVFKNPEILGKLNALVHPKTGQDFLDWVDEVVKNGYSKSFILKEAAILYESGAYKASDAVISVYAPKAIRIDRVVKRDGSSPQEVLDRMARQWPDSEKIRRSDYVIYNDGQHRLTYQVREAIQVMSRLAHTAISE